MIFFSKNNYFNHGIAEHYFEGHFNCSCFDNVYIMDINVTTFIIYEKKILKDLFNCSFTDILKRGFFFDLRNIHTSQDFHNMLYALRNRKKLNNHEIYVLQWLLAGRDMCELARVKNIKLKTLYGRKNSALKKLNAKSISYLQNINYLWRMNERK